MSKILNWFTVVISVGTLYCSDEPCETTSTIDNWHRSTNYTSDSGNRLCDSTIQEGWYRVISGAGETMPTSCVMENQCGTTHPIYVSNDGVPPGNDIYPPPGEEVVRTAYANIAWNCKARSYNIRIKNCVLYYVYYLIKTGGCDLAYCFGDGHPCPDGESSATGFTPNCTELKPDISLTPVVSVGVHTEKETTTIPPFQGIKTRVTVTPKFSCSAVEATDDYKYDIRYYINDEEIPDATYLNKPFNEVSSAVLLQKHWDNTFKPNMFVKCSIQARYKDKGGPSEPRFSDIFFAGMKTVGVENGVWLEEAESRNISVQITMPIGCQYVEGYSSTGCSISIYNGVPNYQTDSVQCENKDFSDNDLEFGGQECRLTIDYDKWTDTHYVTVTGKSDGIANKADRLVFLRLYTPRSSASLLEVLKIWNKITLPDIKLYIRDKDMVRLGQSCYSHNDPHMRIFDGTAWELQHSANQGEYIMYKHERLPQQVNAYFRSCYNWDALCNCGLAVRSANSVFVANFCDTGPSHNIQTNRYIIARMCDDQNLVVEEIGWNRLKITLPSGTTVSFSHGTTSIDGQNTHVINNIDINPSSLDYYLTSGLCGNFSDINGNDDFVSPTGTFIGPGVEFGKAWKVIKDIDSFFKPDGILPPLAYKVQEYCTCNSPPDLPSSQNWKPDYICQLSDKMRDCRVKKIPKTVVHAKCLSTEFKRRKRSIEDDNDVPDMFGMAVDTTNIIPEPIQWRNDLTEDKARRKCEESFNNRPAFSACEDHVPSVNAEQYIDECIADMKIAGSDFYLTMTIQTFESNCVSGAAKMEILQETNTTDETGNHKAIFEVIAESVCPNNCSDRGICKEGVCNCTVGYYGIDCSLNEKTPPTILRKAFRGKCDSSTKPCSGVYIPGVDFIPTNSTCKYRGIKVFENGTQIIDDTLITAPGEYINSFQMKCNLPDKRRKRSVSQKEIASGYYISVSNDGDKFSEELTILIFDATCFECNTSSLECYEIDSCPNKPKEVDKQTNIALIGLGVGCSILMIVIVVVLILCLKKKCTRNPHITDSSAYLPNSSRLQSSKSFLQESDIFMRIKPTTT